MDAGNFIDLACLLLGILRVAFCNLAFCYRWREVIRVIIMVMEKLQRECRPREQQPEQQVL